MWLTYQVIDTNTFALRCLWSSDSRADVGNWTVPFWRTSTCWWIKSPAAGRPIYIPCYLYQQPGDVQTGDCRWFCITRSAKLHTNICILQGRITTIVIDMLYNLLHSPIYHILSKHIYFQFILYGISSVISWIHHKKLFSVLNKFLKLSLKKKTFPKWEEIKVQYYMYSPSL